MPFRFDFEPLCENLEKQLARSLTRPERRRLSAAFDAGERQRIAQQIRESARGRKTSTQAA